MTERSFSSSAIGSWLRGHAAAPVAVHYHCKGSHVVLAKAWLERHLGDRAADLLAVYPKTLLPGAWYELAPIASAFERASEHLGRPASELVGEVAKENALQDLTSIYRAFLRVATPMPLLARSSLLWRNYVRFGEARVIRNEPGFFLGSGVGIPGRFLDWTCGAWLGFLPTAVALAGGRSPIGVIQNKCRVRADEWSIDCEIRYGKK